jgi:enoyl-CoA hydratase/carnithine racemase
MIKQCGEDSSVGSILVTGTGSAFCAGGDVKGMGDDATKSESSLCFCYSSLFLARRVVLPKPPKRRRTEPGN